MKEQNWNDMSVKKWAEEHFKTAPVGGAWAPDGTGLLFLKSEEKKWRLVKAMNHPSTLDTLDRIRVLMFDLGYSLNEKDVEWDDPPATMEEAIQQEADHKKRIAESWADTDGTKLMDLDLRSAYPEYIESKEIILDNGDTTEMEIWAYKVTNPNTGNEITIDPDDYHLLTDDECFMRFYAPPLWYQCMTRNEIIEVADSDEYRGSEDHAILIGKFVHVSGDYDHKVPPWMWGTVCRPMDMKFDHEGYSIVPLGEEE